MIASVVHGLVNLLLLCNLEANDSVWPTAQFYKDDTSSHRGYMRESKAVFLKGLSASYAHI